MSKETFFKPIYLPTNKGLGNALKEALDNCSYEIVARMDSDDISLPLRFEKQLELLTQNPELSIVGGNITEFVGDPDNIVGERQVETDDKAIKHDMRKRCAMNHVSVLYRKKAVLSAGGYLDWHYNEDYYLWIRMIEANCQFANVPDVLVNVRTGADMSARRGGWKYFKSERDLQRYMLKKKIISPIRYLYNVAIRFGGEVIATKRVRKFLYKIVRKKPLLQDQISNISKEAVKQTKKEYPPFSVAMSVYGKDNPEWLDIALDSITAKQTVKPAEIVLIVDGPIPDEIQKVIEKYEAICK